MHQAPQECNHDSRRHLQSTGRAKEKNKKTYLRQVPAPPCQSSLVGAAERIVFGFIPATLPSYIRNHRASAKIILFLSADFFLHTVVQTVQHIAAHRGLAIVRYVCRLRYRRECPVLDTLTNAQHHQQSSTLHSCQQCVLTQDLNFTRPIKEKGTE